MEKLLLFCGSGSGWLIARFFWDDFEFHIWLLFFLLTPINCNLLLSVEAVRELSTEGRRQRYFHTQTLFCGSWLYYDEECFPEPVKVAVSPRQAVEICYSNFWWVVSLKVCHVCLVDMFSTVCYWWESQHAAKPWLSRHMLFPTSSREEQVLPFEVVTVYWEKISLWCQEAPLFSHALISLPVRGLLGKCYFWIYYIFYFFFFFKSPQTKSLKCII